MAISKRFDQAMGVAREIARLERMSNRVLAEQARRTLADLVGQKVWSDAARRYVLRYPAPVAEAMGHPELAVQP